MNTTVTLSAGSLALFVRCKRCFYEHIHGRYKFIDEFHDTLRHVIDGTLRRHFNHRRHTSLLPLGFASQLPSGWRSARLAPQSVLRVLRGLSITDTHRNVILKTRIDEAVVDAMSFGESYGARCFLVAPVAFSSRGKKLDKAHERTRIRFLLAYVILSHKNIQSRLARAMRVKRDDYVEPHMTGFVLSYRVRARSFQKGFSFSRFPDVVWVQYNPPVIRWIKGLIARAIRVARADTIPNHSRQCPRR